MAATFKIGQEVRLNATLPEGQVEQLAVDQEGNIMYLVSYMDSKGEQHSRWFNEDSLVGK